MEGNLVYIVFFFTTTMQMDDMLPREEKKTAFSQVTFSLRSFHRLRQRGAFCGCFSNVAVANIVLECNIYLLTVLSE
jgi:hypothetical protein